MKNIIVILLSLISFSIFSQGTDFPSNIRLEPGLPNTKQYLMISSNGKQLMSNKRKAYGRYETKGHYMSIALEDLYDVFETKIIDKASTELAVTSSDGLITDAGVLKLGDDIEGITEAGVLTTDRYINQNGNTIIHVGDERVNTGLASAARIRSILSLEDGSLDAFNEWIGTNANAGVGAQNNFTYYVGFNIDHETGALIDPDKHGFAQGYEFWYEPVTGEIYAEKHLVLTLPGGVGGVGIPYRIDSHTLPVNDPDSWSIYHTIDTWFLKNPVNDGQYAQFDVVSPTNTNFQLLASGQTQKGVSFEVAHDGTNVSMQINPFGGGESEKSMTLASWQDVSLPSFVSYNYPPFAPNNKFNYAQGHIYPNPDNTHDLGANSLRWRSFEAASIKITSAASPSTANLEVTATGEVFAKLPTHADEAAAVTAGLQQNQLYKTATGEVRIKL